MYTSCQILCYDCSAIKLSTNAVLSVDQQQWLELHRLITKEKTDSPEKDSSRYILTLISLVGMLAVFDDIHFHINNTNVIYDNLIYCM